MWMPAVQETVPEAFGKPEEIQAKGMETDVEGTGTAVADRNLSKRRRTRRH